MSMTKLTREEKKARKQMEKDLVLLLKRDAKAHGWRYADKTIFRQQGDWFVDGMLIVYSDRWLTEIQISVKPFALDDIVSRILGFGGLDGTPLSLRSRGPHCLVLPIDKLNVEERGSDVGLMADRIWAFAEAKLGEIERMTLDDFIASERSHNASGIRQELVAALILAERLEEAKALCETALAAKQWGGSARTTSEGRIVGFFELARAWAAGYRPPPA
jgi:hypothetical protein